jgi:hypothetical protein
MQPKGYRFINSSDKTFAEKLAAETGINSSMFIEFEFTKAMTSGIGKSGSCRAEVSMRVTMKNALGQTIRLKTYFAVGFENTKVSSGVYSQSELMNLFREAIANVCNVFLDDMAMAGILF